MDSTTQPTTAPANPAPANAHPTSAVPGPPAVYPPQPAGPPQAATPVTHPIGPIIYHISTHCAHVALFGVLVAKWSSDNAKEFLVMSIVAGAGDLVSFAYFIFMQAAGSHYRAKFRTSFFYLGCCSNICLLASNVMNIHGIATHHGHGEGAGKQEALGWAIGVLSFCLLSSNMYSGYRHHREVWAVVRDWIVNASRACARCLVSLVLFVFRQPQRLVRKVCGDGNA